MKLSKSNPAIAGVRSNERIRDSLHEHIVEVRDHELEMLAQAAADVNTFRYMQGRIAVLTELRDLLKRD